uniref:Glutaredoxin domain-containing protein n=1 Tax=Lotharella globosa TaxID=91324 RepID=A0A7S3YS57_9EUKA
MSCTWSASILSSSFPSPPLQALFARLGIEHHSVNLDEQGWDSRAAIVAQLITLTGRRTVPNVFISGHSIGGSDDVHHLHDEGRLLVKIADAHSKAASAQTGADDEHKNQSTVELKAQTTGPDAV